MNLLGRSLLDCWQVHVIQFLKVLDSTLGRPEMGEPRSEMQPQGYLNSGVHSAQDLSLLKAEILAKWAFSTN